MLTQPPLLPFRLDFEYEGRPYVWNGRAADAQAAETKARAALFRANPFFTKADRPRLKQLVQGAL